MEENNKTKIINYVSSERFVEIMHKALKTFSNFTQDEVKNLSEVELITKLGINVVPYSVMTLTEIQAIAQISKSYWEEGLCLGTQYIYYNDKLDAERVRIVLFHELGHIILDHTQQSELSEQEASFFAGICLGMIAIIKRELLKEEPK